VSKNFIRSSRPFFPKEDIERLVLDIATALDEGKLRNGKNLREFEQMFAEYIGVKDAIAFDSDGDALETALQHYDVKDREVVVSTNSFISIPNSVVYAGGKVVFADIREDTLSMDPNSLSENISGNTRGVIVTHIAGFPNPDLNEIIETCREHNLFLVEDATHAVGATVNSRKVGTFGDAAVFAFTPTKVLTTGEGGMLVTNDVKLGEEARGFRYYGSGPGKTSFVNLGRHMMLPEISAILGIYQLRRIEEFIAKRNQIAKIYNDELSEIDSVRIIKCPSGNRCSYYKYPLTLSDTIDKVKFTEVLGKEYGIETGNVFYPPCHLQTVYQKLDAGNRRGDLSTAERVLSRTITLPIHAAMSKEDAIYVTDSVHALAHRFA
jgi:perosamine synthetase